jgi:hypothetical protein
VQGPWAERAFDTVRLARLRALVSDAKGQARRRLAAGIVAMCILGGGTQSFIIGVIPFALLSWWRFYLRPFIAVCIAVGLAALIGTGAQGIIPNGPGNDGVGAALVVWAVPLYLVAFLMRRFYVFVSRRASGQTQKIAIVLAALVACALVGVAAVFDLPRNAFAGIVIFIIMISFSIFSVVSTVLRMVRTRRMRRLSAVHRTKPRTAQRP